MTSASASARADLDIERFALLVGQEFGVRQAIDVGAFGQDDRARDERSGERAPARFIDARHLRESRAPQAPLDPAVRRKRRTIGEHI